MEKLQKTQEEWKNELPPDVYQVTRQGGTEAPFSGAYWDEHGSGMYHCRNCGAELFSSDAKFDSGSGWPSFDRPTGNDALELREDRSHGMARTEVVCRRCDAHLGHLFDDGPKETTGQRFCINSCALDLKKDPKK